jgi:hypothetical protein
VVIRYFFSVWFEPFTKFGAGRNSTTGTVLRIIRRNEVVDGRRYRASVDNPEYIIRNHSTGGIVAHRERALKEVKELVRDAQTKEFYPGDEV